MHTFELEKRAGESRSSEKAKYEEGEIRGEDRGSDGGGIDLNLGR